MEGEALLLGKWKNVADLEENINLEELKAILKAAHEREYRHNRFMAAIQGIDLDEHANKDAAQRFEEVKRRADAKLAGKSEDDYTMDQLGLDVEIEE